MLVTLMSSGSAPKTIKLFINQPQTLDFDQADQYKPVQELRYAHCCTHGRFRGGGVSQPVYTRADKLAAIEVA